MNHIFSPLMYSLCPVFLLACPNSKHVMSLRCKSGKSDLPFSNLSKKWVADTRTELWLIVPLVFQHSSGFQSTGPSVIFKFLFFFQCQVVSSAVFRLFPNINTRILMWIILIFILKQNILACPSKKLCCFIKSSNLPYGLMYNIYIFNKSH